MHGEQAVPAVQIEEVQIDGTLDLNCGSRMGFILMNVSTSRQGTFVLTDWTRGAMEMREDSLNMYSNTVLINCQLKGGAVFRGSVNMTQFSNVSVGQKLHLDKSALDTKKTRLQYDFNEVQLDDSIRILLEPGSSMESLQPKLSNLRKVFLETFGGKISDRQGLEFVADNYDVLLLYAEDYKTSNEELRSEVLSWLQYRNTTGERLFLGEAKNRESYRDLLRYLQLEYLELTVRNGYQGGPRFLLVSMLVLLFFAVLYCVGFHKTIVAYVLSDATVLPAQPELFRERRSIARLMFDFFVCVWFSMVVFISPRFPAKFFRFSKWLLILVIFQWLLGLLLILTFIVKIAANYPFVKVLLGL